MSESLSVDALKLNKAALNYRAVNNKVRQQILRLLHKNARLTVTPIYKAIKLEQSATSQHLAILRSAGLVVTERDGTFIFYSINYQRLKLLHAIADSLQVRANGTRL
jgi:DNA-binding transcriptional ArsR family regulator